MHGTCRIGSRAASATGATLHARAKRQQDGQLLFLTYSVYILVSRRISVLLKLKRSSSSLRASNQPTRSYRLSTSIRLGSTHPATCHDSRRRSISCLCNGDSRAQHTTYITALPPSTKVLGP